MQLRYGDNLIVENSVRAIVSFALTPGRTRNRLDMATVFVMLYYGDPSESGYSIAMAVSQCRRVKD